VLDSVQAVRSELITRAVSLGLDTADWTVVDYPGHLNCGDSAIWLGEASLALALGRRIRSFVDRTTADTARVPADTLLVLHGGGNFGGLYPTHHELRIRTLERYHHRRIVQLPQSIEWTDDTAREGLRRAVGEHPDFHLLVRDQRSLAIAQRDLDCPVTLVPDAAFALGPLPRRRPSAPLAVQRRVDREADPSGERLDVPTFDWLSARPTDPRAIALRAFRLQLRGTRYLPGPAGELMRLASADVLARLNLRHAVQLLSTGERLVTDRLHGHVLATLLGIPHIVVNDRFGKIEALWSTWTSQLGVGEFAPDWGVAMDRARTWGSSTT
jgi:exopolysaccharide biosynthesis predicted pyruvyltransferase EpsI